METSYYHISDPLENFKLKVTVRESSRAITGKELSEKSAIYYEEVNMSWQEKVDGPIDIVKNRLKKGPSAVPQVSVKTS